MYFVRTKRGRNELIEQSELRKTDEILISLSEDDYYNFEGFCIDKKVGYPWDMSADRVRQYWREYNNGR